MLPSHVDLCCYSLTAPTELSLVRNAFMSVDDENKMYAVKLEHRLRERELKLWSSKVAVNWQ